MPITVLNNVFHLRSGGSSLLMQVTPAGRLVHLYYGHLLPVGEYSIADFPPASAGPVSVSGASAPCGGSCPAPLTPNILLSLSNSFCIRVSPK